MDQHDTQLRDLERRVKFEKPCPVYHGKLSENMEA